MNTAIQAYDPEKQRLSLISQYNAHEHLVQWTAYDKRTNKSTVVNYLPAGWRLYELSLRYPNANFSSDIIHIDHERNFCIVRARLYLGSSYEASEKRAEAHKQGPLTELDKVETKAKARAARDFGIGTEYALDMDDTPDNEVKGTIVTEAPYTPQPTQPTQQTTKPVADTPKPQAPKQLPQPAKQTSQAMSDTIRARLNMLYERARALHLLSEASAKGFLIFAGSVLDATITHPNQLTPSRLDALETYLRSKDAA